MFVIWFNVFSSHFHDSLFFIDLNVMDWGGSTSLAVALNDSVYIWDSKTGNIQHLYLMESPGSYISSLRWERINGYLAIGTNENVIEASDDDI